MLAQDSVLCPEVLKHPIISHTTENCHTPEKRCYFCQEQKKASVTKTSVPSLSDGAVSVSLHEPCLMMLIFLVYLRTRGECKDMCICVYFDESIYTDIFLNTFY